MPTDTTSIGGFEIPSTDPTFLTVVAVHVLIGVAAVVSGAVAMLSKGGRPAPNRRDLLLLVSRRPRRDGDRARDRALGRGL